MGRKNHLMLPNLHIERLVLVGVNIAPDQRYLLQASVETELTRLLTNGCLAPSLAQDTTLPRRSTGGIQLTGGINPMQLGQKIAQSVYEGISHE